jgi:hypothetical protein
MAIIAKASSKKYTLCPAGVHHAVCCDVVDLGEVEVTYQQKTRKQHKIRLVWQIDEMNEDANPPRRFTASRRYTCSLDEKASLRRDLEAWRGRPFTKQELDGFDLEVLIGVNCQLNVIHEAKPTGDVYDNVSSIMPLGKGMAKIGPLDYVRAKDRDPQQNGGSENTEYGDPADEEIPF